MRHTAVLVFVTVFAASAFAAAEKPPKAPTAKGAPAVSQPSAPAPVTKMPAAPPEAASEGLPDENGTENSGEGGKSGGLPIPRFVSLRTNPINLRTGPGVRYPVDWVYVRRHLPVEVIGEFDTWRRIRDPDGSEGWVHQSMLSGKRTVMVRGTAQALRRTSEDAAEVVATLDAGVIVNLLRCPPQTAFCRVEVDGLQGWLKRDQVWGVYPTESVQ